MTATDVDIYKKDITAFIYESVKMSNFKENYQMGQAEQKCNELYAYLVEEKAFAIGAFDEDCIVGFLWAYEFPFRDDINRLYVSIVHVKHECRNRHIGSYMLEKIETIASEKKYDAIYLHAEASNVKACQFYSRMQFERERIQFVKRIDGTLDKTHVEDSNL